MQELTLLDFLAQMINQQKAIKDGYSGATHWLVTNDERKAECLKDAQKMFDDWKENELRLEMLRNEMSKGIKTINVGGK